MQYLPSNLIPIKQCRWNRVHNLERCAYLLPGGELNLAFEFVFILFRRFRKLGAVTFLVVTVLLEN